MLTIWLGTPAILLGPLLMIWLAPPAAHQARTPCHLADPPPDFTAAFPCHVTGPPIAHLPGGPPAILLGPPCPLARPPCHLAGPPCHLAGPPCHFAGPRLPFCWTLLTLQARPNICQDSCDHCYNLCSCLDAVGGVIWIQATTISAAHPQQPPLLRPLTPLLGQGQFLHPCTQFPLATALGRAIWLQYKLHLLS